MFCFLGYRVHIVLFRANRYDLELKVFPIVVVIYLTGSSVSFSGELTVLMSSPKGDLFP